MRKIFAIFLSLSLIGSTAFVVNVSAQTKKPVPTKSTAKPKSMSKAKPKSTKGKKRVKIVKKVIGIKDPMNAAMIGTWYTANTDGTLNRANRFVFTDIGEFRYAGPANSSSGTFQLREKALSLTWIKIDGVPVQGVMHKDFPMAEDMKSFQIDKYTYVKG